MALGNIRLRWRVGGERWLFIYSFLPYMGFKMAQMIDLHMTNSKFVEGLRIYLINVIKE